MDGWMGSTTLSIKTWEGSALRTPRPPGQAIRPHCPHRSQQTGAYYVLYMRMGQRQLPALEVGPCPPAPAPQRPTPQRNRQAGRAALQKPNHGAL